MEIIFSDILHFLKPYHTAIYVYWTYITRLLKQDLSMTHNYWSLLLTYNNNAIIWQVWSYGLDLNTKKSFQLIHCYYYYSSVQKRLYVSSILWGIYKFIFGFAWRIGVGIRLRKFKYKFKYSNINIIPIKFGVGYYCLNYNNVNLYLNSDVGKHFISHMVFSMVFVYFWTGPQNCTGYSRYYNVKLNINVISLAQT